METKIFTDGSSRGNPGPGGWGAIILRNGQVIELGGAESRTTNNRMEIKAAYQALAHSSLAGLNHPISIFTDSSYLIKGITQWIHAWKRNGWVTKTKEDVLNKDLWLGLDEAIKGKQVKWNYVGGHIGVRGNERCDEIATAFADGDKIDLYEGPLSDYPISGIDDVSHDLDLAALKKESSSRSKAKAFSYVSAIDGKVEIHKTWSECEKRVKGKKGARFKKALDKGEEEKIILEFS